MKRLVTRRVSIMLLVSALVGALAWAGVHGSNLRQRKQARLAEMQVQLRARRLRVTAAVRRGIRDASKKDEMSEEEFWRLDEEASRLRSDLQRSVWQKFLDLFRSEQR
jgi:hypothetical protein